VAHIVSHPLETGELEQVVEPLAGSEEHILEADVDPLVGETAARARSSLADRVRRLVVRHGAMSVE
jgi:hypothetical protein